MPTGSVCPKGCLVCRNHSWGENSLSPYVAPGYLCFVSFSLQERISNHCHEGILLRGALDNLKLSEHTRSALMLRRSRTAGLASVLRRRKCNKTPYEACGINQYFRKTAAGNHCPLHNDAALVPAVLCGFAAVKQQTRCASLM